MTQTTQTIIPMLALLASSGGAGIVASIIVNALRSRFPQPRRMPVGYLRFVILLLYAPRYTRLTTLVLSAVISVLASGLIAALTGAGVVSALDAAFAAAVSMVASQVKHAWVLSPDVTLMDMQRKADESRKQVSQ